MSNTIIPAYPVPLIDKAQALLFERSPTLMQRAGYRVSHARELVKLGKVEPAFGAWDDCDHRYYVQSEYGLHKYYVDMTAHACTCLDAEAGHVQFRRGAQTIVICEHRIAVKIVEIIRHELHFTPLVEQMQAEAEVDA